MSRQESGTGWTAQYDDGAIIFEFRPGMPLSAFGDEAFPVYDRYLRTKDATGLVTVVELEDPFDASTFEVWEKTAQRGVEGDLDRWAVVADGIKGISLRGKIDTDDLETKVTDDRTEAIEWAQG